MLRLPLAIAVTGALATLMLCTAVGTAFARNLSYTPQNIRATWAALNARGGVAEIRCPLTLEGSFHSRTHAKVARSLIGAITEAESDFTACTGGIIVPFNGVEIYDGRVPPRSLPWHLTYDSFVGTLPNIRGINFLLSRFRFGVQVEGFCSGQYGSATDNITLSAAREAGGAITFLTPVEGRQTITLVRTDFGICPGSATLNNSATVTALNSTTRIRVTLI